LRLRNNSLNRKPEEAGSAAITRFLNLIGADLICPETHKRVNATPKMQVNAVITIEGIRVQAKAIPRRQLISIWRALTSKPFPKVKALQLKDDAFDRIICLRRCEEDELRELEEWNTLLTTKGTDACIFNAEEKSGFDYTILVREKHFHSLEKIIKHELAHIVRGDL
jgi:hypothetical protein